MGLMISISGAQEEGADTVELQFLSMPTRPDAQALQVIGDDGKASKVMVMGNMFSERIKVAPSKTWRIASQEPGKQDVILGEVAAIKEKRQLVLLVSKGKEIADGFEVHVVPNKVFLAAGGDMLIQNIASMDFRALIGDFDLKMKPGEQTIITPRAAPEGPWTQVTLFYRKDDNWKAFLDRRWPIDETVRAIVFFYQKPENGKIHLHTVTELPPFDKS